MVEDLHIYSQGWISFFKAAIILWYTLISNQKQKKRKENLGNCFLFFFTYQRKGYRCDSATIEIEYFLCSVFIIGKYIHSYTMIECGCVIEICNPFILSSTQHLHFTAFQYAMTTTIAIRPWIPLGNLCKYIFLYIFQCQIMQQACISVCCYCCWFSSCVKVLTMPPCIV